MKTGIVIVEELRQIVLTPESDHEKQILELLMSQQWSLEIKRGQFFISRGDYQRFGTWPLESGKYSSDESTMLVLRPATTEKTE